MEEEAPSRRSVAELAGRFKSSAPPNNAAGNEAEKPVRRRPPRTLQLPKTQGDDQEPPGVTSPLPTKAKRNSALIEKLQANLTLSPAALMPSPKSPGFRLLPQTFPPPSPVTTVTPTSPVATSPFTEVEGPASFEAPPVAEEGSILSNINKGRVRHSIRRRPPSRRHRKSSSGDEVVVANEGGDVSQSSPNEPEDKTGGGEKEEGGEVFKEEDKTDEVKEDNTDAPTCPEEDHNHEEDQSKTSVEPREGDEKEREEDNGSMRGQEGDGRKEDEEEKNSEKQEEDSTEGTTNTDSKEEEKSKETTSSDR